MSDPLDDLILVSHSGLMNLLGKYAMPPYPPNGETMDCAPLAAELIAAVEAITYAAPGDVVPPGHWVDPTPGWDGATD